MKPRIALLLGDRNGVGPELVAALLGRRGVEAEAHVLVLGDRGLLAPARAIAGVEVDPPGIGDTAEPFDGLAWLDVAPPTEIEATPGRASAAAGREMLAGLAEAARLAQAGHIEGIVFAPLNKQAIHMAEPGFRDELGFLAGAFGHDGPCGEVNVLDGLWTSRVTSHLPLAEVCAHISQASVGKAIGLAHRTLVAAGVEAPRLAVAGLNPHAGDGGMFGREEIEHIAPAVARARDQGIGAEGPFPADSVFIRARAGDFDAVVSMYHDQGQIAMKLMGFGRGVTVLAGLPHPVTTPAHGTAYDIAGKGEATDDGLWQAFLLCCRMAARRNSNRERNDV